MLPPPLFLRGPEHRLHRALRLHEGAVDIDEGRAETIALPMDGARHAPDRSARGRDQEQRAILGGELTRAGLCVAHRVAIRDARKIIA